MVTTEVFKKLKPMLATSSAPFSSNEYIYEVKWDGFRCLSYLDKVTLLMSRNSLDFSHKFPELAGINGLAKRRPLILDGEIVIMDQGVPSFYELQKRGWAREAGAITRAAGGKPAIYVVFDILYAGDDKLMGLPLVERKDILKRHIEPNERLVISEGVDECGNEFYRACVTKGLEGVVAKRQDSLYLPGKRSPNWKKFKKAFEGEFIVCGYKQTHGGSRRVDSLLLGCSTEGKLVYQGTVGVGLGGITGERLYEVLSLLKQDSPLFNIPREAARGLNWVKPAICCAVKFLEPAKDGGLRHPVFRGVREDLGVVDCTGISGAMGC